MKNKILIKVYVVSVSQELDVYIPTNESVKTVIDLIVKSVVELSDNRFNINGNYCLLDCETSYLYNYSSIIRDTNIKNGNKLFLI